MPDVHVKFLIKKDGLLLVGKEQSDYYFPQMRDGITNSNGDFSSILAKRLGLTLKNERPFTFNITCDNSEDYIVDLYYIIDCISDDALKKDCWFWKKIKEVADLLKNKSDCGVLGKYRRRAL